MPRQNKYTPYWTDHPIQRRLLAALLLLIFPVAAPILAVIDCWDEIKSVARDLFVIVTE